LCLKNYWFDFNNKVKKIDSLIRNSRSLTLLRISKDGPIRELLEFVESKNITTLDIIQNSFDLDDKNLQQDIESIVSLIARNESRIQRLYFEFYPISDNFFDSIGLNIIISFQYFRTQFVLSFTFIFIALKSF